MNQALQEKLENAKAITVEGTTPPMSQPGSTKPALWTPASTAEEAEDMARKLGVRLVNYKGETYIGNVANEAMSEVAALGLPLPEFVRVGATSRVNAIAEYSWPDSVIVINAGTAYWTAELTNPGAMAADLERRRMWSSSSPLHPIRHELGHVTNHKVNPRAWFEYSRLDTMPSDVPLPVVASISQRALQDPSELVAEVFAGILGGKEYPESVMELYYRFGGARIR